MADRGSDKIKDQPLNELLELRSQVAELKTENGLLKVTLGKREHDLGERAKELNCLFGIAGIIEKPGTELGEIFQSVVHILPSAWEHPELTCARIVWEGQEFTTNNFKKTAFSQARDITVRGNKVGAIEVFYLGEREKNDQGPFLKEEGDLIDAIAERLGRLTERKMVEQASRGSEKKFGQIFNNNPLPVYIYDVDTLAVTDVNHAAISHYGYTKEEFLGMNVTNLCPEDAIPRFLAHIERVNRGSHYGPLQSANVTHRKKDGTVISVDVTGYPPYPGSRSRVAIVRDITERKLAEEALRESEEKYRAIFKNSTIGIAWAAPQGYFITANPALARIYGFNSPEEMIREITDTETLLFVHPQDRHRYVKLLHIHGKVDKFEVQQYRRDGSKIWVSINASAIRDGEGKLLYYEATVEDITRKKETEDALRESEERFHLLFDNSVDGIMLTTPEGGILAANAAACQMFGWTEEELRRLGRNGIVDFSDRRQTGLFQERGRTGMFRGEYFHLRKDGTRFPCEVTSNLFTDRNGNVRASTILRDNTERRRAEEVLKESEQTLRSLINATKETLLLTDTEGNILVANDTVAERLGKPVNELIGTCQYDYFPMETAELRKAQYNTVACTGKSICFEDERAGRLYQNYAYPDFDEHGKVSRIAVFSTDVTERRQAEKEKLKLQAQLRQSQKMEAIGTLAGGIAHDFNNILTVMTGYGTLLQMQMDAENPMRMYVDQILSSSQKAAQLTQSLLAFSRKQPVTLKPVKLNNIIAGTEKLLKRLLTEDIALNTSLTVDDTTVMADATQVDQVLFNLATNARDAMPKGGTLTVETKHAKIDDEFKQAHGYGETGTYVVISVSDTGTGMDEETKGHIFDPFFTTKEVGKGTGLGLSTVYGIVKQHNGYINVYSELNTGTTFRIYFPVISAATVEEEISDREVKRGEETILVAEDSEAVRLFIRKMLTKYGYTIIEAIDGEDAIRTFAMHPEIDLVIIDSVMPKKNGREVYDEIHKTNPDIKTLFMSGYTKDVVLDKGIEEKDFHFISKPLSPNDLLRKVREVLDGEAVS